jgi:acyl dehydratase
MARESASWSHPGFHTGDYEVHQIVHGEQRLELHGRVETSGDVMVQTCVDGIYDKGTGALVELGVRARDRATGLPLFTAVTSLFIRGEGGFGGPPAPEHAKVEIPNRPPDFAVPYPTLAIQSLLYRHGGHDPHPIHFDPEVARRGGMKAPILMGLNTLGMAGRALLHTIGGSDPAGLRAIGGRFAQPAYNGDILTTQIWVGSEETSSPLGSADLADVVYRVVNQEGAVLLDRGFAVVSPDANRD